MPELIMCPSCSLKHTRRPTGVCPRCQTSTEGAEAVAPGASSTIAPTASVRPVPAAAPAVGGLRPLAGSGSAPLGGLAQSARSKEIKGARTTLMVIGVLTLLVQAVLFAGSRKEVDQEIEKQIRSLPAGQVADPVMVEEFRSEILGAVRLIYGGGVVLGILFIVLGFLAPTYPVPATAGGLVLYIGSTAVFGYLDPSSLARGLIIKVIIVTGLFKAMQAAIAHQKEANASGTDAA